MEKNFCEKSTYCSFLSTHKEDITFHLKCVMEESFYVKNNTYRGFKREKFPPNKMEITITLQKYWNKMSRK